MGGILAEIFAGFYNNNKIKEVSLKSSSKQSREREIRISKIKEIINTKNVPKTVGTHYEL